MADAIATNSTLKELEYALSSPALLSYPLTSGLVHPMLVAMSQLHTTCVCAPCFTTHARPSWCHSLQHNELDDSTKQQLQEAAGGRITFEF